MYVKGVSGNPSGRPKTVAEVRDLARQFTAQMVHTMVSIAMDTEERGQVRLQAADIVLTRAWGTAQAYQGDTVDIQGVEQLSSSQLMAMLQEIKADNTVADVKQLGVSTDNGSSVDANS
jgi:hypothetical protein